MPDRVGPRGPHVVETQIGDDVGLFAPGAEEALVLNATAGDIWRLCDGENTAEEIVDILAGAYGVEADVIRDQVLETIREFEARGLFSSGGEA